MNINEILESINKKSDFLIKLSDTIWEYAEPPYGEYKSADIIGRALEAEGFEVKRNIGNIPNAFSGSFGKGKPVIGILGEYDALFGLNQKAGAYNRESYNGGDCGHGCGHNLLGVGSLAAAIAVKDFLEKSKSEGTVIYFGCPAEEGGAGKAFMAKEGAFNMLDAAVTWHPDAVTYVFNISCNANIKAKFKFRGKSAHAAVHPHLGRSALDAAELLNIGVQFMREHIIPEASIHYAFTNSGGTAPNVVQDYAEVTYMCRAPQIETALENYKWLLDIAKGAALMTQTRAEAEFQSASSDIINNSVLENRMYENAKKIPFPEYTDEELKFAEKFRKANGCFYDLTEMFPDAGKEITDFIKEHQGGAINNFIVPYFSSKRVSKGSTDVGDVSRICPTAAIYVTTQAANTPGHSWQQVAQGKSSVAHKGMLYAGAVMASVAIDILSEPRLLADAKKEHRDKTGGKGYVCPIPDEVKPPFYEA